MTQQALTVSLICLGLLLLDFYLIKGLRTALRKWKFAQTIFFSAIYWIISVLVTAGVFISVFARTGLGFRAGFLLIFCLLAFSKVLFLPFMLADDIRRLIKWSRQSKKEKPEDKSTAPNAIPRSEFLMKMGMLAGSLPLAGVVYGTITGVYDYKLVRRKLYLPNLPKAFDGIRLGQISDIHSGSFYNRKAVLGGVEMLMKEKADFIFFTGDLVNVYASEMKDYQDIFSKVKAPLGVFSSLGNHDYGDYLDWQQEELRKTNFKGILDCHKNMGWDLLRNENRRLKVGGEEIGILGVENWSSMTRFPRRGRLDLATKDTQDLPVKLLLSHDPSHWRAEVLDYPDIDVMFAGHTHGMQFGVRTEQFQWSPIQYIYKEWAGHYQHAKQQLYVNVGYGFLGYPGRLGILPEITIFELKACADPALSKTA